MHEGASFRVRRAHVTARLLTSMSEVHIITPAKHDTNTSAEQDIRVCAARTDGQMLLTYPT